MHHQRSQGHVVSREVIFYDLVPHHFAAARVEREQVSVNRRQEHFVAVQGDPAIGRMQLKKILREVAPVPPQQISLLGIQG